MANIRGGKTVGRMSGFGGLVTERMREIVPGVRERYDARPLEDSADIEEAKSLASNTFVDLGALDKDTLNQPDPWGEISYRFGTFDTRTDKLLVTARLIWDKDGGVETTRLPLDDIDPAEAQRLLSLGEGAVAEIGSLVKHPDEDVNQVAVLKLIREMWKFATINHIQELTCGLHPKIKPRYSDLFGAALRSLAIAGRPHVYYPGVNGPQVPLAINVREAFSYQKGHSSPWQVGRWAVRNYITVGNPAARGKRTTDLPERVSA